MKIRNNSCILLVDGKLVCIFFKNLDSFYNIGLESCLDTTNSYQDNGMYCSFLDEP